MKKIIYILSFALICTSCLKESVGGPIVQTERDKVTLTLSAVVPDVQPLTKTMNDTPQLQNLYLAVFDDAGYLAEYVKAELIDVAVSNNVYCKYKVTLSLSDTRRTIHWIGNAPEKIYFGSEESVMMGLSVSGNQDTYWYRKVIERVEAIGEGDAKGPSDQLISDMSNIPLIRNFAKIKLVDNSESFELTSYAVVNTPKEAYTVAYNSSKRQFVDYMKEDDAGNIVPKTYADLISEGYNASTPLLSSYVELDEAWDNKVNADEFFYVYERERPLSSPAYIIACGKYKGSDTECFYKINLRDEEDSYMPIFRNFQYTINLNEVYRSGYSSPSDAAASTGSGDVSTALETESLIYMSDGTASLSVDFTDVVVTDTEPIALGFAFYPNLYDEATLFKGEETEYQESIEVRINEDAGASGAAIDSYSVDYTGKGNPIIYIVPTTPEATPKSQTLTVIARYTYTPEGKEPIQRSIQRNVKVTVMKNQLMSLSCDPFEIPYINGYKFALDVYIPVGLSRGMFPLDFKVESSQLTITPDLDKNQLYAETGKSLTGSEKPVYFFVKTLSWLDYKDLEVKDGKKIIKIYLKTTKTNGATDIYVGNQYFYGLSSENYASVSLGGYEPKYFEGLSFNPEKLPTVDNQSVTFSFTMTAKPDDGKVMLLLDNFEPAEGENRLTKLDGLVDGKVQYEYPVSSYTGTHSIKLNSPDGNKVPSIILKGRRFIEESKSLPRY